MVVVDASAVAAILFGEPEGPTLAAHLQDETLLAPGLLDFELMQVAVKKATRQPEARLEIMPTLQAISSLPFPASLYPPPGSSRWRGRPDSRPTTPATSGSRGRATAEW